MQFLTKKEVADLLGVTERTVTRRVKEGKLEVKRKGRRVFFPKEQFENVTKREKDTFDIVLETLQKELDEKNKQIEKLQIALNNQQGLTKDITDKILMLPEGNKTPKETSDPTEPRKKPQEKPREKPEKKPEKRREKRGKVKKQPKKQPKKKWFFNNLFK